MSQEDIQVLLVEDNRSVAKTMIQMLYSVSQPESEGRMPTFSIHWVGRLQAAEKQLEKRRFDAILLDLALPDSDGLDTFVHTYQAAIDTPIVVLTATDDANMALEAVQAGAQDYLVKGDVNGNLLARAIRYAIERQRVESFIKARNKELRQLNRASQALVSSLDLNQVLNTFLEETRHLLGVDICSVWLFEASSGELVCQHATGPNYDKVLGWRLKPKQGIAGSVAASGKSLIVPDVHSEERHFSQVSAQAQTAHRSILSVPLRISTGVIGVLQAMAAPVDFFRQSDLQLLELLAPTAATAITNAQLYQQARQDAANLRARNEELDAFSHTVAHDLKSPLANVLAFAELLSSDSSDEELREDVQQFMPLILQNAHKMHTIIEGLLLLAGVRKMDIGMLEPLDMNQLVAEARGRLVSLIDEAGAEVVVPAAMPSAYGYAPWIEEVWVNFLSNALKYGGIQPKIELGGRELDNDRAMYWVRDRGPGMSEADQKRLFTPFTRLDQVNTKGHGLGLSIVRRIIEKLGGSVGVESEPGKGSTFYFSLPTKPE
jgi:signal transduction histidine kinase/DNA-binding response OmpR family regulator